MRTSTTAALAALAILAACDTGSQGVGGVGEQGGLDRHSREHETCSRSADCAGDLRCFDGVCRRSKLSVLGDLYTAVGDRALTAGKIADASTAYGEAVARYEQEKLEPPAPLLCAQGSALSSEPGADPQKLERAARLLHRCLSGAPPGSFLRQRALGDLAGLMEHGLDPDLLVRREPADLYLTRKPTAPAAAPAPASDSIEVHVKLDSRSRARSVRKLTESLEKADLRAALTPCWKAYFEKTRKESLAVALPLQYGSAWDEDETYLSSWIKLPEELPPGQLAYDPATTEATTCARQAMSAMIQEEGKKLREETRWQAVASFTVAPRKQ
ncbi:MAG TPA: hypothetical protein VK698_10265 [Kofleriaceae bacterium]|nr:hypothetical protein [Kofleriaceae bacterium]